MGPTRVEDGLHNEIGNATHSKRVLGVVGRESCLLGKYVTLNVYDPFLYISPVGNETNRLSVNTTSSGIRSARYLKFNFSCTKDADRVSPFDSL